LTLDPICKFSYHLNDGSNETTCFLPYQVYESLSLNGIMRKGGGLEEAMRKALMPFPVEDQLNEAENEKDHTDHNAYPQRIDIARVQDALDRTENEHPKPPSRRCSPRLYTLHDIYLSVISRQ
jgi:hypothetical protein